MERVCFLGRVRPERLEEYRERHERVWPDMLAALRQTGWGNYSLFLTDDGLLIGYLETQDYQAALSAMGRTDVNARWQTEMAPYFTELTPAELTPAELTPAELTPAELTPAELTPAEPNSAEPSGRPPDQGFRRIAEIFHLD